MNPKYFNQILEANEFVLVKVENLEELINDPEKIIYDRHKVYYDEAHKSMICTNSEISYFCRLPHGDRYEQQSIVVCDDTIDVVSKVRQVPYASTCKKFIENILHKDYTDEEIEECLNSHSLDTHQMPIHITVPYYYEFNTVYKVNNCVYYDINNAHLDALTEIFPKSKRRLVHLRALINKYKASGELDKAQDIKDYINIYCGNLGKTRKNSGGQITGYAKHRGTYEWIVNRTRNILQSTLDYCQGEIIYANTDGAIIHCPQKTIETSNKLGEFKSELANSEVYIMNYRNAGDTPYLIYQYLDTKNNKIIKGNCPNEMREQIDLAQGKYVSFKKNKVLNHFEYTNIKEIKGNIENVE